MPAPKLLPERMSDLEKAIEDLRAEIIAKLEEISQKIDDAKTNP